MGRERLQERQQELEARLFQLDKGLPRNSQVRIEKGELVVSPLRAEDLPGRNSVLQQAIQESLPLVELPELLAEVDSWTHLTQHQGRCKNRTEGKRAGAVKLALFP